MATVSALAMRPPALRHARMHLIVYGILCGLSMAIMALWMRSQKSGASANTILLDALLVLGAVLTHAWLSTYQPSAEPLSIVVERKE